MHKLIEMDNNSKCENYKDYLSDDEQIADEEIPLSGSIPLSRVHQNTLTNFFFA